MMLRNIAGTREPMTVPPRICRKSLRRQPTGIQTLSNQVVGTELPWSCLTCLRLASFVW